MDQNTLQLTDCIVRYDSDGNLEFNYQGSKSQESKSSGPTPLQGNNQGVTWVVQRSEVERLQEFISKHRSSQPIPS